MATAKKIDIHEHDRQLTGVLSRIQRHPRISEANKATILRFYERLMADTLSLPRVIYYLNRLSMIATWIHTDFEKVTRKDIEEVMGRVNRMDYTEWTKKDYRVAVKKFFKWLRGCDEKGVYPPEVRWISTNVSIDKQELPHNLPNEEDVKKMIEAAEHPRNKALIASLYESGCRIGELAALRIGDVNFDEYGAYMIVHGKTGSRRVRLVFSAPILASWMNVHPDKSDREAPLWVVIGTTKNIARDAAKAGTRKSDWGYAMKYRAIAKMIKELAQKAGVQKKVNPHAWRHARATFLANKLTEQQLKHMFGWGQASRMAATYVHLSGRDVDDALLAVYGMKKTHDNDNASQLSPADCPRCKEPNEYNNVFCKKCGWALDKAAAVALDEKRKKADEILNALTKDPESLRVIAQALAKLGLVDKLKEI
ncbi:MAG: tyrosine-type recombinase/integrase [Phycisphaerae bacterium]|nr:tyrosine-type recombinase/integrase [Phycisphaerae bacterium]